VLASLKDLAQSGHETDVRMRSKSKILDRGGLPRPQESNALLLIEVLSSTVHKKSSGCYIHCPIYLSRNHHIADSVFMCLNTSIQLLGLIMLFEK
jgi:hypothetical protein